MNNPRLNYMVWPPLKAEAGYISLSRTLALISWFAGPTASCLRVPITDFTQTHSHDLPSFVSLAAISDFDKIEILSRSDSLSLLESERHVLLIMDRKVPADEVLSKAQPLAGSEILINIDRLERNNNRHQYYYLGNPEVDVQDAFYAVCLSYWVTGGEDRALLHDSQTELIRLHEVASKKERVALFGTGPSLSEALSRNHDDSFNIICNTIIKNRRFAYSINPQILVAADAHFHFSYHRYSAQFLIDLVEFLSSSNCSFFTFDKFAVFLRLRIPEIAPSIFGIPSGRKSYGFNFDHDFRLFPGDSVLNMFLLPIASFLGEKLSLNGFTGRSRTDSYFWSHSELHQYVELMEDVRFAHPKFFANRDYGQYAQKVDEEILSRVNAARTAGKDVRSETTTFYLAFQ